MASDDGQLRSGHRCPWQHIGVTHAGCDEANKDLIGGRRVDPDVLDGIGTFRATKNGCRDAHFFPVSCGIT
jgi:hypothetical protein